MPFTSSEAAIAGHQHNARAHASQSLGRHLPNARGRTCDNDNFSLHRNFQPAAGGRKNCSRGREASVMGPTSNLEPASGGRQKLFRQSPKAVMRSNDIMSPLRGFTLLVCSHTEASRPRLQFFAPLRGLTSFPAFNEVNL
jgi:hypothetical protein